MLNFRQFLNPYEPEVTAAFVKKNIVEAINTLFGEVGTAVNIDLIKCNSTNTRVIIRVPESHYLKLRSSLTLASQYEGQTCVYKVHKASPLLLGLLGDSRNYIH